MNRWVTERFDNYGVAFLAGGAFLALTAFLRTAAWPFSGVKITVLVITAVLGLAAWVAWSAERRSWLPPIRLGAAALAFLVASAVATVTSMSPAASLFGEGGRVSGLVPVVIYAVIALCVVGFTWEEPARLRTVLWAIASGSVVLAASVVLQEAGIDRVVWAGPVPGGVWDYPIGTIGHSEFAGAALGVCLPAVCYLARTGVGRRLRTAVGTAMALDVVALWFTQSRSGMLAAAAGLGAMAWASRNRLGLVGRAVLAAGIAVVVALFLVVAWHPGADAPVERIGGFEALRTQSLQLRLSYWRGATAVFLDHPLTGTGLNTFYAAYPPHRPAADGDTLSVRSRVDKPHNIFLEHASDGGVPLIGSYLVLVGSALSYGWRRRLHLDGNARLMLASLFGMLVGYLAQAPFSIDEPSLAMLAWLGIAGICAMADPAVLARRETLVAPTAPTKRKKGSTTPRPRAVVPTPAVRARWAVHGLVLAGALTVCSVALRPLAADVAALHGDFAQAIRLMPFNAEYHRRAFDQIGLAAKAQNDADHKARLFALARFQLGRAQQLRPGDVSDMADMARLETEWASSVDPAHFADAQRWWRRAVATDPNNQALRASLRDELPIAKARAITSLEAATSVRPDDVSGWVRLAKAYLARDDRAKAHGALQKALGLDLANREALALLRQAASAG